MNVHHWEFDTFLKCLETFSDIFKFSRPDFKLPSAKYFSFQSSTCYTAKNRSFKADHFKRKHHDLPTNGLNLSLWRHQKLVFISLVPKNNLLPGCCATIVFRTVAGHTVAQLCTVFSKILCKYIPQSFENS